MKNRINYLGTKACTVSHAMCGMLLLYHLLLTHFDSDSFPLCNFYLSAVFCVCVCVHVVAWGVCSFVILDILMGILER